VARYHQRRKPILLLTQKSKKMEKIHVSGEITGVLSREELVQICKEKDLVVCVLVASFLSESLEYFEIEYYLDKRYRKGYYVDLVKRSNQKFYCKGYNS
jgi:seryl-tRNA(Sec) selenium transferase